VDEKPVAQAPGNHRRASRKAEKAPLARAFDARALPERAQPGRALARVQPARAADARPSALPLRKRRAVARSLCLVARP
jgi:hypothetical protein